MNYGTLLDAKEINLLNYSGRVSTRAKKIKCTSNVSLYSSILRCQCTKNFLEQIWWSWNFITLLGAWTQVLCKQVFLFQKKNNYSFSDIVDNCKVMLYNNLSDALICKAAFKIVFTKTSFWQAFEPTNDIRHELMTIKLDKKGSETLVNNCSVEYL